MIPVCGKKSSQWRFTWTIGTISVGATSTPTQNIRRGSDAIYLSTDNTVVSALSALADVASARGVPIISADPSSAEDFEILAAYGFDYYSMGRATGRMVKEILDGKDPGSIATKFMTDPNDLILLVNLDIAKKLGLSLSADILTEADKVVENGSLRDN